MSFWLLKLACLDASNDPQNLYFSDGKYTSDTFDVFPNSLRQPALINISPKDGGVFSIFGGGGAGEIELLNKDNALDFMAGYAFDGRKATITFIDDDGGESLYLSGTINGGIKESDGGIITLSLKAFSDGLDKELALDEYDGTGGLEGGADVKGKAKPWALGYVENVTPVAVDPSLLIFEASARADALVVKVYDDGVALSNYLTSAAASAGAATVALDSGLGGIAINDVLAITGISGRVSLYKATSALSATAVSGSVGITPALREDVPDNAAVDLPAFFDTDAELIDVGAALPETWGGRRGLFRLADNPAGEITCDVVSVDLTTLAIDNAFDAFEKATAAVASLDFSPTIDTTQKAAINALGPVSVFVEAKKPVGEILGDIAKSIGGLFWFEGENLIVSRYAVPSTPVYEIIDAEILSIARVAVGIGPGGVPAWGFKMGIDRIETVQTTVAGSVSRVRRTRLSKAARYARRLASGVKARHLAADVVTIEGILKDRAAALSVIDDLNDWAGVDRHVIDLAAGFAVLPTFGIGDTVRVTTPRRGYSAGRDFIVLGIQPDLKRRRLVLRLVG